jgi:hypothetical protein
LQAQFKTVYDIDIRDTYWFDIYDVRNPPSLKKSDLFQVQHLSNAGTLIATFTSSTLFVQMKELAEMDEFRLDQSNRNPGEKA